MWIKAKSIENTNLFLKSSLCFVYDLVTKLGIRKEYISILLSLIEHDNERVVTSYVVLRRMVTYCHDRFDMIIQKSNYGCTRVT